MPTNAFDLNMRVCPRHAFERMPGDPPNVRQCSRCGRRMTLGEIELYEEGWAAHAVFTNGQRNRPELLPVPPFVSHQDAEEIEALLRRQAEIAEETSLDLVKCCRESHDETDGKYD